MRRHHRDWTDRYSGYLAGELPQAERSELEAHLARCGDCRDALAGLREVVARARDLPAREPPRDLWPGIASAIGGPLRAESHGEASDVIELSSARRGSGGPRGQGSARPLVSFRRPMLAAAAAALVMASAGTAWWIASARPYATSAGARGASDVLGTVSTAGVETPPEGMAVELAALEELLVAAREVLDPNTVRVLERNLGVIEQAIADSREALQLDPGNAFLTEHLDRMYRRKLVYLQDVVRVVQWSG